MLKFMRKNKLFFLFTLACIFNFLILIPVLNSDYFGDDLYNFQVRGAAPYYFDSIYELTVFYFKQWVNQGRFFPLAWYVYGFFYIFSDVFYYKIYLISITVLSVLTFSWMVYTLSSDKRLSLLVLVITPIFFQFRFYHDAFLSFHGLIQLVSIYLFVSIGFLKLYLNKQKYFYLIVSMLFWLISLLTYEITYTFILMFILIAWGQRNFYKIISLYLTALLSVFLVTMWFRFNAPSTLSAYTPNFDVMLIIKTWIMQTVSVLPSSYYIVARPDSILISRLTFLTLVLFAFVSSLILNMATNKNTSSFRLHNNLIPLGVALITLPGFLISFSPKYQVEVGFGIAYLPIFIAYFGLSLIVAVYVTKIKMIAHKLVLITLMMVIIALHNTTNNQVVDMVNQPYKNTRIVLTQLYSNMAVRDFIKEDSLICFEKESPLNSKEFLSMYMKKRFNVKTNLDNTCNYFVNYSIDSNQGEVNIKDLVNNTQLIYGCFEKNKAEGWTCDQLK